MEKEMSPQHNTGMEMTTVCGESAIHLDNKGY